MLLIYIHLMHLKKYVSGNPSKPSYVIVDLRGPSSISERNVLNDAISFPIDNIHAVGSQDALVIKARLLKVLQARKNYSNVILVCSDGSLRSKLVWELIRSETKTYIYKGGVRGLKKWIRQTLDIPLMLYSLHGPTGSGKTELLALLKERAIQTIDFEGLAGHAGSVFGSINHTEQPSQLQFELRLACAIENCEANLPVVVESEQINIGQVSIPSPIWKQLEKSLPIYIQVHDNIRLKRLVDTYAGKQDALLIEGINYLASKIQVNSAELVNGIKRKEYEPVARVLMKYFDSTSGYASKVTSAGNGLEIQGNDLEHAAQQIATYIKEKAPNKPGT